MVLTGTDAQVVRPYRGRSRFNTTVATREICGIKESGGVLWLRWSFVSLEI